LEVYVVLLKARELAHYLTGKKEYLDFLKPKCQIERQDFEDVRRRICSISYAEWKKMGASKGSLHY
jgi:CRISP-associated protein Cas1